MDEELIFSDEENESYEKNREKIFPQKIIEMLTLSKRYENLIM